MALLTAPAERSADPELAPAVAADIEKFERVLGEYLAGRVDDDAFRVFRLNNGIYGQRQGGHNQMVRIKLPGGAVTPDQLDVLASVSDTYSRGWGHLTTRQNVQFHFVQLERVPELLRDLAAVGLTTREACGDTVRNVMACHLAGACPAEVLDVGPWAEATFRHFLHHPYAQRLPRKFKVNFSGCARDCGQAMFNDVGVVAVSRPGSDGRLEAGFRVFLGGGLGANPHPAQVLEDFTPRDDLLVTIEAVLRTFDHDGERNNNRRARLKWVMDNLGVDEVRRRVLRERTLLLASSTWPGGVPALVEALGDEPAGGDASGAPARTPVRLVSRAARSDYERWRSANVVEGAASGTVSAIAHAPLGDLTAAQFRALASAIRDIGCDAVVTNRQNIALRGVEPDRLVELHARLVDAGLAQPGAELARDVVSCPGADTCNLAVTQSRGLASDIGRALEEAGLADVEGVRVHISGCTNSCGQHHVADIGLHGVERRVNGVSAPGYQLLLGGHLGDTEVVFGQRALRLPAKAVGAAVVRIVGRYHEERDAAENFTSWLERSGGASAVAASLSDLDEWPSRDDRPDYYIDFDETGPFSGEVGEGEGAAS